MEVVARHLPRRGYDTRDTHLDKPYDFVAERDGSKLWVEVKRTRRKRPGYVLMTRNEVGLHGRKKGRTALFIVYGILVEDRAGKREATGGRLKSYVGWDIDTWDSRRSNSGSNHHGKSRRGRRGDFGLFDLFPEVGSGTVDR